MSDTRHDQIDPGSQGVVTESPKREKITPENLPLYYANSVEVRVSLFDFVLTFGFAEEATQERVVVRDLARVAMSPQHTKALLGILSENARVFEEKFGAINLPEGALRQKKESE